MPGGLKVKGHYGYAGQILRIDFSSGSVTHIPTMDYTGEFD